MLRLRSSQYQSGTQDGHRQDERQAREPGCGNKDRLIGSSPFVRGQSQNRPDTRPQDEIVGKSHKQQHYYQREFESQDRRPSSRLKQRPSMEQDQHRSGQ